MSKAKIYYFSFHGHTDLCNIVRNSEYFQNLPSLQVEIGDIDGDYTTLPIIFEDVYCDHIPMSNGEYRNIVEEATLYDYKWNSTYGKF